ncbi:Uncharacterized protein Adt_23542 [Abeliophyllum distichum]|uniref:Uncharacterized protein n=1 Tax=Abeliophyllum distichum TaxID=126358 RepID=A0ABD1SE55_9LAMI
MGEAPTTIRTPMEYLIVDKSSSYHGVLRRPALINLETITLTKFLCMNFSTDRGIATIRRNQSKSRACYTNAMRKFVDQEVHIIDVEMRKAYTDLERIDVGPKEEDEQMIEHEDPEDLDPCVIEDEPRTSRTEKLEFFVWIPLIPLRSYR